MNALEIIITFIAYSLPFWLGYLYKGWKLDREIKKFQGVDKKEIVSIEVNGIRFEPVERNDE